MSRILNAKTRFFSGFFERRPSPARYSRSRLPHTIFAGRKKCPSVRDRTGSFLAVFLSLKLIDISLIRISGHILFCYDHMPFPPGGVHVYDALVAAASESQGQIPLFQNEAAVH